jgi:hypothetical protein
MKEAASVGGLTLSLASDVSDHSGEAVDEVLHPSVSLSGRGRLKRLYALTTKIWRRDDKNSLWSGAVM